MQVLRLSALILISFSIGCASTVSREIQEAPKHATAIMGDANEVAAQETAEDVKTVTMRVEEKESQQNFLYSLWWTWKYAMWGQGSSEAWPWAW